MKLLIELRNNLTRISLIGNKKVQDSLEIEDPRSLSEQLLIRIDQLLSRNKLKIEEIFKVETKSDLPDSYTSTRIIEATAKGLNFKG